MTYLDSALLNLTERLCQRFQALTGCTNVWLAFQLTNLSVLLYVVWLAGLYRLSHIFAARLFIASSCILVLTVVSRMIFKTPIDFAETQAYRRVAKGLRNPRRLRDLQLRIAFLTLSIMLSYPLWLGYVTFHSSVLLLTGALVILTTVVLYVLACDPLPPCAGRVREWLRGWTPARAATSGADVISG